MKRITLIWLMLLPLTFLAGAQTNSKIQGKKILVFSKTGGWRHGSIPFGQKALQKIGKEQGFEVVLTEDSLYFTKENLKQYASIVFCNTTGDILNADQEAAFEAYINNGGGFMGIHAASDTEHDWSFYSKLIGAQFKNHPKTQEAMVRVHKDKLHPAIAHYGSSFKKVDEWYNFKKEVPSYVNVLLDVDESSYKGQQMGTETHPIAWYHFFEGGRVFYTGMGHTNESYSDPDFVKHITEGLIWTMGGSEVSMKPGWTVLLDDDLSNFNKYIGVPHTSVEGDFPKSDNVTNGSGTPFGFNNDPKQVFKMIKDNGVSMLKVSGEIYGGLTTKETYGNYHLKAKFKWGDKKYEPRLNAIKDNGILYHCQGKHGRFWDVWMYSLECQIQEGDMGDFIALGTVYGDANIKKEVNKDGKVLWRYHPKGDLETIRFGKEYKTGWVSNRIENDKPDGEWNTIEIYTLERTSVHVVNGVVVNVVKNARKKEFDKEEPVSRGVIQLQSEGVEAYYKEVMIKEIKAFPKEFKKYVR